MNDLEKFGPKLSEVGNKNPFTVPDGYFDSLPSRVQDYCKDYKSNDPQIKWLFTVKSQLAIAAGFCLLILIAFSGFYFIQQNGKTNYYEKVDYIKIVLESGTEFDEIQLYEAFINGVKKDTLKNSVNDELIDYLLIDNIDNGILLNHSKDIKP
jgi:hypothetical protein